MEALEDRRMLATFAVNSTGFDFDGNLTDGVNPLFNTGMTGDGQFGISLPNIPPGIRTQNLLIATRIRSVFKVFYFV